MRLQTYLVTFLAVGMMLGSLVSYVPDVYLFQQEDESNTVPSLKDPGVQDEIPHTTDSTSFSIAADTTNGILDPIGIEQQGYETTGTLSARTDTGSNTVANLSIDSSNDWVASQAQVDIWNLNRLYVVNGSFDDGIPGQNLNPNGTVTSYPYGWSAISNSSEVLQTQVATYDTSGTKFVIVENQGEKIGPSGNQYDHLIGTQILWNQTLNNVPYTENFILRFRFFYLRGPLEKPGGDTLIGNCSITVAVDGESIYKIYLPDLDSRAVWYDTGDIPITLAGAGSTINFTIGLTIDETLDLNAVQDLDNDGVEDGIANTVYVTSYLDDVSFASSSSPSFDEIAFNFTAGADKVAVTGSAGTGNASITKGGFWTTDPLTISLEANVSVSFDYNAYLLSHRFIDSTWTSDIDKEGVAYSISYGTSADLTLNTYVGTVGEYENFTVIVRYPDDWDNVTVFNPFLTDETSSCTITTGMTSIPDTVLSTLGWWKITIQSPNYLKSTSSQIYNPISTSWSNSVTFRPSNETRISASLGTQTETPNLDNSVNVTWLLPNGTEWSTDSSTGNNIGEVNSTSRTFGGTNTSAGLWSAEIHWSNGSEVAYDEITFGMYHSATLTPLNPTIETDADLTVNNFLYYVDSDNGEYLLDEVADIDGNWSSTTVSFTPNLVKNWWEGDFDTSIVGGGVFTVIVNASRPYFDNVSCSFTITSTYTTSLDLPEAGGLPVYTEIDQVYTADLLYQFTNGTGVADAVISAQFTGPSNGLSFDTGLGIEVGNYTVEITALKSGTYSVTITASKEYYYEQSDSFTLIVEEKSTNLIVLNGTSGIVQYGDSYILVLQYTNSSGDGLVGADVDPIEVSPATGLTINPTQDLGNGNYSLLLIPSQTESYTIVIQANISNHVTQIKTFTLTVTDVQTSTSLNVTSVSISIYNQFAVNLSYVDDASQGIASANVTVIDPPTGLDFFIVDRGDGNYTITVDTLLSGSYLVRLSVNKTNYEDGFASFSVVVGEIGTYLVLLNGTSDLAQVTSDYTLVVEYTNETGGGLIVADVEITDVSPAVGLSYDIFTDLGNGNYSIVLSSSAVGTFTITFQANLTNHVTKIGTFTLTATEIPTTVSLNVTSVSISVYNQFAVNLSYVDDLSQGIDLADVTVIDPPTGLDFFISDAGDGNYTITVETNLSGSYLVRLAVNRTNHEDGFASFSVVVSEIGTYLISLNGTSDLAQVTSDYTLVVQYTNETGSGLAAADVEITDVSPAVGLSYGVFTDQLDGSYSISLSSTVVGTFTITFQANLTNHVTKIGTFTLTTTEIPTTVSLNVTSVSISVYTQFAMNLKYIDDLSQGIDLADITVINPPTGLDFFISDTGNGNYTITVDTNLSGSYLVRLAVNRTNYEDGFASFSVVVGQIGTYLIFMNGSSDLSQVTSDYTLVVQYTNETGSGLAAADVEITDVSPAVGLSYGIFTDLGNGNYSIILSTSVIDTFTITVKANITNHVEKIGSFTITTTKIPTSISLNISSVTVSVAQELVVQASFFDENMQGITGATISIVNPPVGLGIVIVEDSQGNYSITVDPQLSGSYLLTVSASRINYEDVVKSFSVIVDTLYTDLDLVNGTSELIRYGENYNLTLRYTNGTGHGLLGADVSVLNVDPASGITINPAEELSDGYYQILLAPTSATTFTILFYVNLTNYLDRTATFTLTVTEIPTVINLNEQSSEISLDQNYTVRVFYGVILSYPIEGAEITILHDENDGLNFTNVTEEGEGWYNFTVTPPTIGTFTFTVQASKPNYQDNADGFTLIVTQIVTSLEFDDADRFASFTFSHYYNLSFSYIRTDTETGIDSANIQVTTTPSSGFEYTSTNLGNGSYVIAIRTNRTGSWFITVSASKDDYLTSFGEFTIEVVPIETDLTDFPPFDALQFEEAREIVYNFTMQNGSKVVDATINVEGRGISWLQIDEFVPGYYTIVITPEEIGENFRITLTFEKEGHVSKATTLQFTVIPGQLRIELLSPLTGTENQDFELRLQLFKGTTNQSVLGANVRFELYRNDIVVREGLMVEKEGGIHSANFTWPIVEVGDILSLSIEIEKDNYILAQEYSQPVALSFDPIIKWGPYISVAFAGLVGLVGIVSGRRVYAKRRRRLILQALEVKKRFDSVRSLIGVVVLHKKSGLPIYSKVLKGGFDESMISAFITAITQFRSEFAIDARYEDFSIVPISDILSTVETTNLICSFITVSKPTDHLEDKMLAYTKTVALLLDRLYEETPAQIIDFEQIAVFDRIFDETLDGFLVKKHKVVLKDTFPKGLRCIQWSVPKVETDGAFGLEELAVEMAHCGIEEGQVYLKIMTAIEQGIIEPTQATEEASLDILWDMETESDTREDPEL